jgi:hypothetical protein
MACACPELKAILANCPKAQAFSIYDRCRVRYERYWPPLSSCVDAERSGLLAAGEVGAFAAAQANADQAEGAYHLLDGEDRESVLSPRRRRLRGDGSGEQPLPQRHASTLLAPRR